MREYLTLVRRELGAYFLSLTGYVVIAVVVLLLGFSFVTMLSNLNNDPQDMPLTELFYSTMYFWLILLLATPVITMRTFALEKSAGTYETLMTVPIGDWQVVLAKFTGSLVFYLVMWLPLVVCLLIVNRFAGGQEGLTLRVILSTYLGILLLGMLFISAGCFASSLTRSQIIAAMISFALGVALFLLSFLSYGSSVQTQWQDRLFTHVSMLEHMQDFVRGIVDTRYVVFYLSMSVIFLFLNVKVVESRRWK